VGLPSGQHTPTPAKYDRVLESANLGVRPFLMPRDPSFAHRRHSLVLALVNHQENHHLADFCFVAVHCQNSFWGLRREVYLPSRKHRPALY